MRVLRHALLAAGLCALPLSAQQPSPPPAAAAAARAAMADTARGAQLTVYVLTVGQGDPVWERYGHNLLMIVDTRTGQGTTYEWGVFSFNQPWFMARFLFGNTRYYIGADDAAESIARFARMNREVIAQELELTPGQRAALDAFVRTNAMAENAAYRYDYFLDNCSTRLRDALDFVLGGALRTALSPESACCDSYRSETLRLNQHNPVLFLALDVALGRPADRMMTPWEASFIPMRLRDALRNTSVALPDGRRVPLVKRERVVSATTREAEAAAITTAAPAISLISLSLGTAILVLILGELSRRGALWARGGVVGIAVFSHFVVGFLAALLVFMWLFTKHTFWAWNPHLLLFTPISLGVAVSLARTRTLRETARWVRRYHLVMALSGFAVAMGVLLWHMRSLTPPQAVFVVWANAAWLFHAAMGTALTRMFGDGGPVPSPAASPALAVQVA